MLGKKDTNTVRKKEPENHKGWTKAHEMHSYQIRGRYVTMVAKVRNFTSEWFSFKSEK